MTGAGHRTLRADHEAITPRIQENAQRYDKVTQLFMKEFSDNIRLRRFRCYE